MHYFLSFLKFKRINIFLFSFAVLCIVFYFVYNTQSNISSRIIKQNSTKSISHVEEIDEEGHNTIKKVSTLAFLAKEYLYTVQKGDSIIKMLSEIGFSSVDVFTISSQINQLYDISTIYIGQQIKFAFHSNDGSQIKVGELPDNFSMYIENTIIDGILDGKNHSYDLKLLKQSINSKSKLVKGFFKGSLYNSAMSQGASAGIIMSYMNLFSNTINFKKDVKAESEFKILFDFQENSERKKISNENILYAYLSTNNKKYEIYQYKDNKGKISYYYNDGNNIKSSLLRKPIKKARISSGFGMRFHPILKCKKMHKGVDYAAIKGTPILAAGDGVVQMIRYGPSYGRYLAIKHNHRYSTLYAHLSKFKPGIKQGGYVKQGRVIGYVGSSGNSTGSHLHYEIRKYGKPINPSKVKALISHPLEGNNLIAFNHQKKKINSTLYQENKIMFTRNNTNKK